MTLSGLPGELDVKGMANTDEEYGSRRSTSDEPIVSSQTPGKPPKCHRPIFPSATLHTTPGECPHKAPLLHPHIYDETKSLGSEMRTCNGELIRSPQNDTQPKYLRETEKRGRCQVPGVSPCIVLAIKVRPDGRTGFV